VPESRSVLPGTFGVTKIRGRVGWWIGLLSYVLDGNGNWSHAFVVLDDNTLIEAEPGGARIRPADQYGDVVAYNDAMPLSDEQRARIVAAARSLQGRPYNWRDYGALILAKFGVRPSGVTVVVNSEHQLICSQLVDVAYKKAGIHLFNDGRESGDVTPGDLADLITRHRWT
jgi:uncharacterized protein YycO